jgi:hypothetical protein
MFVGRPILQFAGFLGICFYWPERGYLFFGCFDILSLLLFLYLTVPMCSFLGRGACPPTPPRACRERSPPEGITGAR